MVATNLSIRGRARFSSSQCVQSDTGSDFRGLATQHSGSSCDEKDSVNVWEWHGQYEDDLLHNIDFLGCNDGQFFIFIVEDGHHSYHHRATTNKQQQQPAAPQPPAATSKKEPHRAESSLFKVFCISHKLHLYSNFEKERKNDLKCFRRSLKINDICELFDKILMTELKNQFFDKI